MVIFLRYFSYLTHDFLLLFSLLVLGLDSCGVVSLDAQLCM